MLPEEFEALGSAQTEVNTNQSCLTTSRTLQEAQVGSMMNSLIVLLLTVPL